ncbi:MAG: prepilin-type N-terminal cleavage/methylation domain-containing protein [Fimbriimonadaceae bacterium]
MKNKAFTLIELLVVIAIIAILAAILFPVFASAKTAAKQTQSISNIKQVALGLIMYSNDYNDMNAFSEYGSGDVHQTYTVLVNPYVKTDDVLVNPNTGVEQSWGTSGIFRSPAFPVSPVPGATTPDQAQIGGFSYGVHHTIFADNFESDQSWFPPEQVRPSIPTTQIEDISNKVMMMEKGANLTWSFPWFHPWQAMWVGSVVEVAGDESTLFRDGVDVYEGGPLYDPRFDTDCNSNTEGNWECAAHARYRFNESAPMAFMDGHAKSIRKGAIKWYENIFVPRDGNQFWNYWYLQGEVPY